ncbi:MAG: MoxR family ATPase [Firmicutes bacterium]|nr:MoxR family ATPase [Bacillota bacterium]
MEQQKQEINKSAEAAGEQQTARPSITEEMQKAMQAVIGELKKVIVGKDDIIRKVLMVVIAGGHILLEDVPGVGKTTLALGLSKVMNLDYRRMQFTPDTMASDITGFSIYNKETGELEYKPGAAMCNLFLADEINRTSAKTQAALLEVMEEGGMTVDGVTHRTPDPFVCIATQNPLGSAGTQKLPDSQLDRFMARLSMGYPDLASQVDIVKQRQLTDPMDTVRPLISAAHIKAMRKAVQIVRMEDEVIRYAAELCEKTRSAEAVEQGVSPRAVLALVQMAKAAALMDGRDYAIPQDVKSVFIDVCAHRLILTARARIRKETEEKVLQGIMAEVNPPQIIDKKKKQDGKNA